MIFDPTRSWAALLGGNTPPVSSTPGSPLESLMGVPNLSWLDIIGFLTGGKSPLSQYQRAPRPPIPDDMLMTLFGQQTPESFLPPSMSSLRPSTGPIRPTGMSPRAIAPISPAAPVALPMPQLNQPEVPSIPVSQPNITRTPTPELAQWLPLASTSAQKYNVPLDVVMAIMEIESSGNPKVISSAGAQGLMQVMPFHFNPGEQMLDPSTNIDRGVQLLAREFARYKDWDKAAAAYFGAIDRSTGEILGNASDIQGTTGNDYTRKFREARQRYLGQ